MDRDQLKIRINQQLQALNLSHCELLDENDNSYWFLKSLFSGGRGVNIDWTGIGFDSQGRVRYALDASPAQTAGLVVGDVIELVDGVPFRGQSSFAGTAGKTLSLAILRGGKRITLHLAPIRQDPFTAYLTANRASIKQIRTDGKRLGYVHLWIGGNEKHLEELLSQLNTTDALILDLRDGYGATQFDILNFIGPQAKYHAAFGKPVAVLINFGTRSGKEVVAYKLQQRGFATLIGEPTAGAVLGGSLIPTSGGFALYVPTADALVDGHRIEGNPVQPDIRVTNDDTMRDKQLDAAISFLVQTLNMAQGSPQHSQIEQSR